MKIAVCGTQPYDRQFLSAANQNYQHELCFFKSRLNEETYLMAAGFPAVCAFVNDTLNASVLTKLVDQGTRIIALRCAGFNNVDLEAAAALGLVVTHVPGYSPQSIAEHTIGLILSLNRNIHRAYHRVRDGNFALEGFLGFELQHKTVGVIGTGKIGVATAKILVGFGCKVIAYDPKPNVECSDIGIQYVTLQQLIMTSDVITLHCPLNHSTLHLIDSNAVAQMKKGVMLINTSRGAVIDTTAIIAGLKSGKIGYLGLDVYEQESDLFFQDLSSQVIQDDLFERLLTFPNVLITGHQGFLTVEALSEIARITLLNVSVFESTGLGQNQVTLEI